MLTCKAWELLLLDFLVDITEVGKHFKSLAPRSSLQEKVMDFMAKIRAALSP